MKIAVASCTKLQQINPQPVWSEIQIERPDVLLLTGDNVYLDHDNHKDPAKLREELQRLFAAQLAEPNFAALLADLRARGGTLLAIYDDHDFLGNNCYGGDHDPALREAARDVFIRAFAPVQTGADVYTHFKSNLVDVIVLDERFYRTMPTVSRNDRDAILGAAQWAWFEQAISKSTAKFLIVASSTTFHTFGDESWEQYPTAFERMRALIKDRRGRLIVSGDVHRNTLYDDSGVIEVVSSAVARHGVVFGAPRKNYGILTFNNDAVRIQLRSLKAGGRFDTTIELANWRL